MSETQQVEAEQSAPSLGPGDRLQAARISIGLTLEDVASKMHLSTAILNSLEDNEFEEITAPIFVKGYLRSYARIVNLDEEDIIQQYSRYYTHNDPPISSTSNTSPEINSADARVKGTTWLVILVLIGLLVFWWWSRYQQPTETVSLDSNEPSEIVADNTDTSESISFSTDDASNEVDTVPLEVSEIDQPVADVENSDITLEQTARNELETLDQVIEPLDAAESVTQQELEVAPETEQTPATTTSAASSDLVITVNADTWADIKDANGNRLVYDLLKNGQRITLTGQAPFQAFLGNGYGVSIQYQGENIDLSKNIRADNTARIKIGQ